MKTDKEIYSKEELELFEEIENGNYISLPKDEFEKEKTKLQIMANNTMKQKPIKINIFEKDFVNLKAKAMAEGLSYDNFITSVLHKVAIGKIRI